MVGNEQNCNKCKKDIRDNYYQCDICNEKVHTGCANLSSSETRCMPLQKKMLFFACDDCKCVLKNIPKLVLLMEEVKEQLRDIKSSNPNQLQQPLRVPYSEITQRKKHEDPVKKNEEVIVVKPKDKQQDSLTTKKAIERQINPSSIGAEVSRVKFVRDGGIAISCTKKDDIKNISHNIRDKMSTEYDIELPEKKNPKIKIINIEKHLVEDHDVLIETIILQNRLKTEEDKLLKILHCYEDKRRKTETVILEVDPKTYDQLNQKEVLHIGWRKCRFFDHINIIQCYKCYKFGHIWQTNAETMT